jgi:hypothetical protein
MPVSTLRLIFLVFVFLKKRIHMPEVPAFLVERMERWMGAPATVTNVQHFSPTLRLISFVSEQLKERPWIPGQEIEIKEDHLCVNR